MSTKRKPQRPRLERRNALKNVDYDASISSTSLSSSFDDHSAQRTRSLDILPLTNRTSFRIEGNAGEFDIICRSLGLSGPEDFAIPAAAWQARKFSSPSGNFPSSRFRDHYNSPEELTPNSLSVRLKAKVKVNDEVKVEDDRNLADSEARVRVYGEGNGDLAKDEVKVRVGDEINVKCSRGRERGIKGIRPPVLAPPPVMSHLLVDDMRSTWELCRSFGPCDDEGLGSPEKVAVDDVRENEDVNEEIVMKQEINGGSPEKVAVDDVRENEDVNEEIVMKQEINGARLSDSTAFSESSSDISDYDNGNDSYNTLREPMYSVSPSGIKSWQKGDFLGCGSFGTVYEGFTDDGFFFAVKEVSLLDQGTQGKQSILQLEQEISLLSRFQHDNIVRYLGTDTDDGKLYIFLELVTKGSLASLYQKYHLRDSQVSIYTRQILNGLNYLHKQNVVHRDIKCANILVDVSGSVKLADFGLAKATTFNDVKSCKGTAFWMAPEVVNRKNPGYGLPADIWSLGCTVLEMLTRQVPYSHLEGMQALFRIGRGEPPPMPDSLSRDAQDFILKCLEVNPDKRPTAAHLLDHPFVKGSSLSTFLSPASPHYIGMRS